MVIISVLAETVYFVDIPTAFTPNSDGVNDVLAVLGGPFSEYNLTIFNEWGNLIFQSTNQNIGWDGYYKGKLQMAGTYIAFFEGIRTDGETFKMAVDVTLIKQ